MYEQEGWQQNVPQQSDGVQPYQQYDTPTQDYMPAQPVEQLPFDAAQQYAMPQSTEPCSAPPQYIPQSQPEQAQSLHAPAQVDAPQQWEPAVQGNTAKEHVAAGHAFRSANQHEEAVRYYQAAANLYDPEGLYWLANCVLTGVGVPANDLQAVQLYSLAARAGHMDARKNLFRLMDRKLRESLKTGYYNDLPPYMQAGAEGGHLQAAYMHGYFLTTGALHVPQDREQGYYWLRFAADNGFVMAQKALQQYF